MVLPLKRSSVVLYQISAFSPEPFVVDEVWIVGVLIVGFVVSISTLAVVSLVFPARSAAVIVNIHVPSPIVEGTATLQLELLEVG